jgi:ribulose-phosphate 3-epimerase
MTRPLQIAPSILSADFTRLGEEIQDVEKAGADWIHIDVMDGQFVPNLTVGPLIVEAARRVTSLPLDVHLMIHDADALIPEFAEAGADYLTVHVEACPHLHRTIQLIKEKGVKAGVSLNPATSLSLIEPILPELDLLLVMSVNPGFGGQAFIPAVLEKLKAARRLIDSVAPHAALEVDGGIKIENALALRKAGADIFVAGSAIFGKRDYAKTIAALRAEAAKAP